MTVIIGAAHSANNLFKSRAFFTANELYQKIWGKDSLGDVRTVQVHIHNLRSKIEPDPAKPVYLCNVWGKGYVFRPEGKQG